MSAAAVNKTVRAFWFKQVLRQNIVLDENVQWQDF